MKPRQFKGGLTVPSKSKPQARLMAAVAHNPAFAKKVGISQSVGKEFNKADKGKTFNKGGAMKHEDIKMDKKVVKKAVGMHDKQQHGGKKTNLSKLAKGGLSAGHKSANGVASKGKTKGKMVKMNMGGKAC